MDEGGMLVYRILPHAADTVFTSHTTVGDGAYAKHDICKLLQTWFLQADCIQVSSTLSLMHPVKSRIWYSANCS